MAVIKRQKRKYLNKKFLLSLIKDSFFLKDLQDCKQLHEEMPIELFQRLTRILLNHYLTRMCPLAIITSRKMDGDTFYQHMQRRRQVEKYLREEARD